MQKPMDAESFIASIHPLLKASGFRKSNATWRKDQGESVAVFNVQKSAWGGGAYYLNMGVYFHALGSEASPTENKCHVQRRLDVDSPASVVEAATEWFHARASLQCAALLAEADSKKGLVFHAVRTAASA
jgi:hypothetical protein